MLPYIHSGRDFTVEIKLRILKWGDDLGLSDGPGVTQVL